MEALALENICKTYPDGSQAVSNFNLIVEEKEFIVLVGPSGCGKSTTLRMIAGLEEITDGSLRIALKQMNDVAPKDRDIAMVFQNYALYPHMNVYGNMAFGLKLRRLSKKEIDRRVKEAADILELTNVLKKKPSSLSGGQRQRVALGRAIVRDASLFLMDEPLSNLDAKLRVQMRAEISKLHQRLGTTTVYVTHDQTEAMTMATRLVVMKDGIIQQIGAPKEVYDRPNNIFIGGFIGAPAMNFFHGKIENGLFTLGSYQLKIPEGQYERLKLLGYEGKAIKLGIRPEYINQNKIALSNEKVCKVKEKIQVAELTGSELILHSMIEEQSFIARVHPDTIVVPGEEIELFFDMDKALFFDVESENRV
ncbi:ABC transporter ATP-binding protein [Ureibacillus aquaedulcis]|uniref:Sn-glycerol-3-phosphate ABC transporter ATP-binding protein UgpC n=1 Tax=Ureibacillus aquaedulcis TaxID=3058421 RepID=A0ABT8GQH6_9BACL|nr:sn-glycerol-3-phosphate ABC transporter ATP-binding protein UgpC [Ureibacillus sp. BA0131]MDN4493660.1 sn-glycerol-3-phosphate ABC transporter ATP-binding protein UgpC [Ureibacillus sp. BA0131]